MYNENLDEIHNEIVKLRNLQMRTMQMMAVVLATAQTNRAILMAIQANSGMEDAEVRRQADAVYEREWKESSKMASDFVNESDPPPANDRWWDEPSG